MEFDSFDGGDDGENNDVAVVQISEILAMQGELFSVTEPFEAV